MEGLIKLDKTVISIGELDDTADEKSYWLLKSYRERITAIEINRIMVYGEHRTTSRLQRFLEVSELEKG